MGRKEREKARKKGIKATQARVKREGPKPKPKTVNRKPETGPKPGYAVTYWEGTHKLERVSARYTPEHVDLQFARRELLRGVGEKPHVILDVGAGTGEITAGLEHPNIRVVSMEPAKTAAIAKHKAPHNIVRGVAERLGIRDSSVDGAFMGYTLEYTNRDHTTGELLRVMKPGARAVLLLHKPGSDYMMSVKAEAKRNEDFGEILRRIKSGAYKDPSEIRLDFEAARLHEHPEAGVLSGLVGLWETRKRKEVPKGYFKDEMNRRIKRLKERAEPIAMLARGENVFHTKEEAEEYFTSRGFEVEKIEVLEHPGGGTTGYGAVLRKPKQ